MKTLVSILFCLIITSAAQAFTPNPATDLSYGVWFDRDTPSGSSQVGSQIVFGETGGFYDIDITYHAVDADTATMFATINGVQQGFYINGVDFTPAGLSFTSDSLAAMEVFWGMHFPKPYGPAACITDITATGTRASGTTETTSYADLAWYHTQNTPIAPPAVLNPGSSALGGHYEEDTAWDLLQGDLVLSYTVDFSQLFGERQYDPGPPEWWGKFFLIHFGLQPDSREVDGFTPDSGGWMGNVGFSGTASPDVWSLMDKFDLQRDGVNGEWIYDVPEPATIGLLATSGLAMLRRTRRQAISARLALAA